MQASEVVSSTAYASQARGDTSTPMLSADQVSSILQRVKEDNELLLQRQRHDIVQQVMQNLRDAAKASDSARGSDSNEDDTYVRAVAPIDAEFNSVRSRVDSKTLAILEKSKALLRQTKDAGRSRDTGEVGGRNFVERMREMRVASAEGAATRAQAGDGDPVKRSEGRQAPENAEEQHQTESPAKDAPPAIRCDIDLLRPPERSPENEDEWENELARQILTIYATSVKAKAAGVPMVSSCSLPALRPKSDAESRTRQLRSTASVHYSWEPSQRLEDGKVVINMPKHGEDGGLSNEARSASLLAMCEHRLCEEVRRMEAKSQFGQCVATLESLLVSLVRARGVGAFEAKLWKQLVVTCNAFASRCVDYKKFPSALQLIQQAEQLVHNSVVLADDLTRLELLAFLYDTYAHYYYRKRKPHAGLQYVRKAHEIHAKQASWSHLAKCRLHLASLLSFQRQHQDAMAHLASILELIERNKLEEGGDGASAQKICLAAVCYNNLAVEQLHLRDFEAASVSSANAKRLARLCLSYSNRWLAQFEATSSCAALAIATLMEDARAPRGAPAAATAKATR
ncbi:hypothetical protein PybrP1_005408 [[Pythium] brassicae (nom. inval.)]|nr:hypothetical protein PybrP1_005408 [[Pythium] brassicae (nom. inval.)]